MEPSDRTLAQHWSSALLTSSLVHIILILSLSLIAIGSADLNRAQELIIEPNDLAAQELAILNLRPLPMEANPNVLPELSPASISVKMDLPLKLDPMLISETDTTTEADTQTASEESATRIAESIQQLVSQAGGSRGEVQFALAWNNINDVDLHVIAPSGERISHLHKHSRCKGELDVDMNVRGESKQPVENVRWISDAPSGRYTVLVNLFRIHRPRVGDRIYSGSKFQLLAQLGQQTKLETETVSTRNQLSVFRFYYAPEDLPPEKRQLLESQMRTQQQQEEEAAGPLLASAADVKNQQLQDQLLNNLINRYPHTDAAIEAMQMLGGNIRKTGF